MPQLWPGLFVGLLGFVEGLLDVDLLPVPDLFGRVAGGVDGGVAGTWATGLVSFFSSFSRLILRSKSSPALTSNLSSNVTYP